MNRHYCRNFEMLMMSIMENILYLAIFIKVSMATSVGYFEAQNLQACLLSNYSRLLSPRLNQSESVSVYADFYLTSVIDFSPVSGIMAFAGVFLLHWNDEIIETKWQQCGFTDLKVAKLGVHDVWIPNIYVRNTASISSIYQYSSKLESETSVVIFHPNGSANMSSMVGLQTTCKTDVTYYPLDTHTCDVTLATIDIIHNIRLYSNISTMMNPYTYSNSEWVISTQVQTETDGVISEIRFSVILSRKPVFLMTNIVFPVMIITIVNGCSFLVPIESGERLSFGISLLLMYIVFLTTVVDILPSTDNSLSYFNIFVFTELIYSCFIVFGIILTLYLHYHSLDKNVPSALQKFTKFVLRRHRKTLPEPSTNNPKSHLETMVNQDFENFELNDKKNSVSAKTKEQVVNGGNIREVTWKDAAKAVDRMFRIVTTLFTFCLIVGFIVIDIKIKTKANKNNE